MKLENGEKNHEHLPLTPEVQETIAHLDDFKTIKSYEKPVITETEEDKERNLSVAKIEAENALIESQKVELKKTPGDEPLDTGVAMENHKSRIGSKARNWTMAALGTLFGFKATAEGKLPTSGPKDSTKNKIESVSSMKEGIDDVVRQDWNDFSDWIASKGLKASETLDKGGLGYKLFDEYVATHKTSLSRETLKNVRAEFVKLRNSILQSVKDGTATLSAGATPENLLKGVLDNEGTNDPLYPGSKFTSQKFPKATTITFAQAQIDYNKVANKAVQSNLNEKITDIMSTNKKVVDVKNEGFVKPETTVSQTSVVKNK